MSVLTSLPEPFVEAGGERMRIAEGFRAHIAADMLDRSTVDGGLGILLALMGAGGDLPRTVAERADTALAAALAWHDAAMGCMPYGRGGGGGGRRTTRLIDWEADGAIIAADFLRLYRIDLASEDIHWYKFCALLLALQRTPGSLVGQASSARLPPSPGTRGEELKRLKRLQRAWALPPTDAELAEEARRRFEG